MALDGCNSLVKQLSSSSNRLIANPIRYHHTTMGTQLSGGHIIVAESASILVHDLLAACFVKIVVLKGDSQGLV